VSSNFGFLQPDWPELLESAGKAEEFVYADPRTSCFYARRTLELFVQWLYRHDAALKLPYQEHLSALIHEPTFKSTVGPALFAKTRVIKDLGNLAVHSARRLMDRDALRATTELFHLCFWLARSYSQGNRPADALSFDASILPRASAVAPQTLRQLQQLEADLDTLSLAANVDPAAPGRVFGGDVGKKGPKKESQNQLQHPGEGARIHVGDGTSIGFVDTELERLRAKIAEIKKANADTPDKHNYSEAETRDYFIDLLLKEAGWPLDKKQDREYPVSGMPNEQSKGFVDYVLWGDDGKALGLVEAKRTKRDAKVGQQQAKLYADCLEKQFGQRPIIFYSNGYDHWIWDDLRYPPREVQGFYEKQELELLIQRRTTQSSLARAEIDPAIVERYYQTRAIRAIGESFEKDHERKALLVMATGAGKTRTVIALCDLLMRCNWVKRVLFLADRVALVKQAVNAFKKHLPSSSPVNLVTERDRDGRVFVSTYPTMLGLIDETNEDKRRVGVGHFDLVIIDEAHRSVYQKYRAIFEYFDSYLVGLTATPRSEIDHNTYSLFDLEAGIPTDAYELEDAVKDGFLVPMQGVSVPLKFQREGIKYDELSEEEKERWDAIEWDEDGNTPMQVDPAAVNAWLFNEDTVDKVLEHVMLRGIKVANGDRLGKTILFAKNHAHAQFIQERFDKNYPHLRGEFARVIDFQTEYVQNLIDTFSIPEKNPHLAISVDMLDTGIDIPEVVNLVFFKIVRSKTKFWQMVGRGTRLRPDLFGPGRDKKFFYIFDYCQNLEFFSQNPDMIAGAAGDSLTKKLFVSRVELVAELDRLGKLQPQQQKQPQDPSTPVSRARPTERNSGAPRGPGSAQEPSSAQDDSELRKEVAERLRTEVEAMNINNFIVRPKRRLVEKYRVPESWEKIGTEQQAELDHEVAGLPSELVDDDQEAKEFDLLILKTQLALLRRDRKFTKLEEEIRDVAAALEEKAAIPMVAQQMELILDLQTDDFWQDITTPILENVRKRLRLLIKLIDKIKRQHIYTDFEDLMGGETAVELPGFATAHDVKRFTLKKEKFLAEFEADPVIQKLRWSQPLSKNDLDRLEQILLQADGLPADVVRETRSQGELGLFVLKIVGLERQAAKRAFETFLSGRNLSANQIHFVNMIVNHLAISGWIEPGELYGSPFTDFSPLGVEGLFNSSQVQEIVTILSQVKQRAAA
jgi:type I restriction enzyme R subunit